MQRNNIQAAGNVWPDFQSKLKRENLTTPQDFEDFFQHRTGHSTVGALTACWQL